nr:transposase, MuDR, MULE transposase domain protein [Tanacetum cinerariifolium]
IGEPHGEKLLDDSYSCKDNEESYHRLHNTDNEDEFSYEVETYSFNKKDPTIQVKNLVETHSCIRSNKSGNKSATQGWIANVVSDKLKSDRDVSVTKLRQRLMKNYNVDVPYKRVYRGKEQAFTDMNPGSIVDITFDIDGDKKRFQCFFVSQAACSLGFLAGCRPYISLDAFHLKVRCSYWLVIGDNEKEM